MNKIKKFGTPAQRERQPGTDLQDREPIAHQSGEGAGPLVPRAKRRSLEELDRLEAMIADLDRYPWPDLSHPSRFEGLAARCKAIQDAGYASVLMSGVTLFEQAYMLRGVEECLMDLAGDEEFYLALQDRIKRLTVPYVKELCRQVGPYADVICTGGARRHSREQPGQDILPFLRQHPCRDRRPDRDRRGSPEPGPGDRRSDAGHGATQA